MLFWKNELPAKFVKLKILSKHNFRTWPYHVWLLWYWTSWIWQHGDM